MWQVRDNAARWPNKVGPYRVTRVMGSGVSACLATAFKVRGPSYSVSSACSTGAHCIGTAVEQIQLGKCDMAFAGLLFGASFLSESSSNDFLVVPGAGENEGWETAAMFDSMGALSTIKDEPTKASRAFDNSRKTQY